MMMKHGQRKQNCMRMTMLLWALQSCDANDVDESGVVPTLDSGNESPETWANRAAAQACEVYRTLPVESIDLSGPEAEGQMWGYDPDAETWTEAAHVRIDLPDINPNLNPSGFSWVPIRVDSNVGWEHTYMLMSEPGEIQFYGSNEVPPGFPGGPRIEATAHDASTICPSLPYGWYIQPHPDTVNPSSLMTGFKVASPEIEIVLVHPERPTFE